MSTLENRSVAARTGLALSHLRVTAAEVASAM
jgi:hypothetical protein